MTQSELMKKIQELAFVKCELELFLDTHPGDEESLEKMKKYRDMARPLVEEYEQKYGPLTKNSNKANTWNWIKGPWPWESEEDC
jgi:spore coat protein JB